MIKTETRDINGLQVTSVQYPAMPAYRLAARLGVVLGPAFASLDLSTIRDINSEVAGLPEAVGALLGGLAQDTPLVLELLKSTSVVHDGNKTDLMSENAINAAVPDLLDLLMILKFVLEVNFSNFLKAGLALMPAQKEAAKTSQK